MDHSARIERKLTTILAADAADYSGRMHRSEEETVRALRRSRNVFETRIAERRGRIANTAGDGLIAEFASVVEAVAAAVSIQRDLNAAEGFLPFRIGLHLGDVIIEGDDLLGDGVNLASRLEALALPGGILASQQVIDHAKGRLAAEFAALSPVTPKHLTEDIAIYAVIADGVRAPDTIEAVLPRATVSKQAKAPPDYEQIIIDWRGIRLNRRQVYWTMGGLFVLDITTGAQIWSPFPIIFLAYMLRKKRKEGAR